MGEIKSTLDIIMEKTRNLTLTDEEKKAFRYKEMEGKIKGLIVKFLDGLTDMKKLEKEIRALEEKNPGSAVECLKKACLERVDPLTDNVLLLDILENVAGLDISSLRGRLTEFRTNLDHEKAAREQALTEQLRKKGISGSAVLPNIRADENWIRFMQDAKEAFIKRLPDLL